MENVSIVVRIGFILITLITIWFLYKAAKSNGKIVLVILPWMVITGVLGISGFYEITGTNPPRFIFLIGPWLIFLTIFSLLKRGRVFMLTLDIKWLTLLHTVRLGVEVVLYFVFKAGLIPDLMTFEGFNFDILSGITAPVVYYLVYIKKSGGRKLLLAWNVACLLLLANIVSIALLSAKTPFQQLAFEQPNVGVAYFPLVWLPAVVVPIVLFSHLSAMLQLFKKVNEK